MSYDYLRHAPVSASWDSTADESKYHLADPEQLRSPKPRKTRKSGTGKRVSNRSTSILSSGDFRPQERPRMAWMNDEDAEYAHDSLRNQEQGSGQLDSGMLAALEKDVDFENMPPDFADTLDSLRREHERRLAEVERLYYGSIPDPSSVISNGSSNPVPSDGASGKSKNGARVKFGGVSDAAEDAADRLLRERIESERAQAVNASATTSNKNTPRSRLGSSSTTPRQPLQQSQPGQTTGPRNDFQGSESDDSDAMPDFEMSDGARASKHLSQSLPSDCKRWKSKVTVPEPFSFSRNTSKQRLSIQARRMQEDVQRRKREEEAEHKFRPKPVVVPRSVREPKLERMSIEQKAKTKQIKAKAKEVLLATQKPFSFYESDQKRLEQRRRLNDEAEGKTDVTKTKENSVPCGPLVSTPERKAKKAHLQMIKQKTRAKIESMKSTQESRKAPPPQTSVCKPIPDFKTMHDEFEKQLEKKKQEAKEKLEQTAPKAFLLDTDRIKWKDIEKWRPLYESERLDPSLPLNLLLSKGCDRRSTQWSVLEVLRQEAKGRRLEALRVAQHDLVQLKQKRQAKLDKVFAEIEETQERVERQKRRRDVGKSYADFKADVDRLVYLQQCHGEAKFFKEPASSSNPIPKLQVERKKSCKILQDRLDRKIRALEERVSRELEASNSAAEDIVLKPDMDWLRIPTPGTLKVKMAKVQEVFQGRSSKISSRSAGKTGMHVDTAKNSDAAGAVNDEGDEGGWFIADEKAKTSKRQVTDPIEKKKLAMRKEVRASVRAMVIKADAERKAHLESKKESNSNADSVAPMAKFDPQAVYDKVVRERPLLINQQRDYAEKKKKALAMAKAAHKAGVLEQLERAEDELRNEKRGRATSDFVDEASYGGANINSASENSSEAQTNISAGAEPEQAAQSSEDSTTKQADSDNL